MLASPSLSQRTAFSRNGGGATLGTAAAHPATYHLQAPLNWSPQRPQVPLTLQPNSAKPHSRPLSQWPIHPSTTPAGWQTASRSPGIGAVQAAATPKSRFFVNFYDDSYDNEVHSGERRHRPSRRAKSCKSNILCLDEVKTAARTAARGSRNFLARSCAASPSRCRRSGPHFEYREDCRMVSVDSSEDEWDAPMNYPDAVVPPRNGPKRRDADDYEIAVRDLFPWASSLLDACCSVEKPTRYRGRTRGVESVPGRKLETVCLDCGNVLQQRQIPSDLVKAPVSLTGGSCLGQPAATSAMLGGTRCEDMTRNCDLPGYDGYRNWTVACDLGELDASGNHLVHHHHRNQPSKVPLPNFASGPARCFRNAPGLTKVREVACESELFVTDDSGRVELPTFPEISSPAGNSATRTNR